MNKRIKELALKAYNNAGQGTPEALSSFMEVYSEKFTKSIIEAVLTEVRQVWYDANNAEYDKTDPRAVGIRIGVKQGALLASGAIKEHFGFEE